MHNVKNRIMNLKKILCLVLISFCAITMVGACKKYSNNYSGVEKLLGNNTIDLVDETSDTFTKKATLRKEDNNVIYLLTYTDLMGMTIIFEVEYEKDSSKAKYEYTVLQNQTIIKNTGKINLEKYKSGSALYALGFIEEDENNTASVTAVGNYLTSHIRYINDYLKKYDMNVKALGYVNFEG